MSVFQLLLAAHLINCAIVVCSANRQCPPPETNDNVGVTCSTAGISRSCSSSTSPADTRVLFTCKRHYIPAGGQQEKFCMETGNWSDWRASSLSCRLGCGRSQVSFDVITGHVAETEEPPPVSWHVGIYRQDDSGEYTYTCGGTLIESDVVITAAVCVSVLETGVPESTISKFKVRLGIYNKRNSTSGKYVYDRTVKRIVVHDNYMKVPDSPFVDNIALIFLKKPVSPRDYAYPVCSLHKLNANTEENLETAGKIGFVPVWNSSTFSTLSYLPLSYVPSRECAGYAKGFDRNLIFETNYCASTNEPGGVLCEDDSGAGMVFLQHEKHQEPTWHLEGIVNSPRSSLERTCFDKHALVLRLKDYKMWILQTIARANDSGSISDFGNCTVPAANPNVDAKCFDSDGLVFPCTDSVAPGTVVKYRCRQFYIAVNGMEEKICLPGRMWSNSNAKTLECELDCGRSTVPLIPAIIRGSDAQVNQWPWHAGIFLKHIFEEEDGEVIYWENICGGTLINEDTVVTAAHCVAQSETSAKALDNTELKVGLGKLSSDLDSGELHEQTFRVRGIVIHQRYKSDDVVSLDDDIALVFLERHVVYTVAVLPVCSHHNQLYDTEIGNGTIGWVPGWGITEDGYGSIVLKMTGLPFVSRKTCEDRLPKDKKKLISENLYCAGFFNDTNVCQGDSGGGMVFHDDKTGKWYLEGIVSHSLFKKGNCFTELSFFVRVAKYKLWMVKQIDVEKRRNRGYGWCPPLVPKKGHHIKCGRILDIGAVNAGSPMESTCYEWQPPRAFMIPTCMDNYYSLKNIPLYSCSEGKWVPTNVGIEVWPKVHKHITCIHECGNAGLNWKEQQVAAGSDYVWPWRAGLYFCTDDVYCTFSTTAVILSSRIVMSVIHSAILMKDHYRVVVGRDSLLEKIHVNDTRALKISEVKFLSVSEGGSSYQPPFLDTSDDGFVEARALILDRDIKIGSTVSPVCFTACREYDVHSQNQPPLLYKNEGMVTALLGTNLTSSLVPVTLAETAWTTDGTSYSAGLKINDPPAEKCLLESHSGAYLEIEVVVDWIKMATRKKWVLVGLLKGKKLNAVNCSAGAELTFIRSQLFRRDIIQLLEEVHGVEIEFETRHGISVDSSADDVYLGNTCILPEETTTEFVTSTEDTSTPFVTSQEDATHQFPSENKSSSLHQFSSAFLLWVVLFISLFSYPSLH